MLANLTLTSESQASAEGQFGVAIDHRINEHFSLRAGYRHGYSLDDDNEFTEHRFLLEQSFHFKLPGEFSLNLRTREDFRWVDGKFSARLRERALLEREVEIAGYKFTPYGSAEIYYDSRFRIFNRHQLRIGSVFPIVDHVSLDIYYARQNDIRSQPNHIDALGLIVNLSF